jgi:hypothetical protein
LVVPLNVSCHTTLNVLSVTNLFKGTIKELNVTHKYSDDPEDSCLFPEILPQHTSLKTFKVGFNTGFLRVGGDYWKVSMKMEDGTEWETDGWVDSTLHKIDSENGRKIQVREGTITFLHSDGSGSVTDTISILKTPQGYNGAFYVKIKNDFPVDVDVQVSCEYQSNPAFSKDFKISKKTTSTDYLTILYKNEIFVNDNGCNIYPSTNLKWNLSVIFDNVESKSFQLVKIEKDSIVNLNILDNSKTFEITLDGKCVNFPFSKNVDVSWVTPFGYNTMAFLKFQNSTQTILHQILLTHTYSDDIKLSYFSGVLGIGSITDRYLLLEYNTGFGRTGSDYWILHTVDDQGNIKKNSTSNKMCMMSQKDATDILFKIDDSNFIIDLPSGKCTDSMILFKKDDNHFGIDFDKPYNQNAYLASHNAFASKAYGYYMTNQYLSIKDQLSIGVTTLMLDIWFAEDDIYCYHGGDICSIPYYVPSSNHFKLSRFLQEVKEFLTSSPKSVITIIFEDKIGSNLQRKKVLPAFESVHLDKNIFKDYENVLKVGWPTLNQMISTNQNLVVFNSNSELGEYNMPNQWEYMSENNYGDKSLDSKTWVERRDESKNLDQLGLCALNHFETMEISNRSLNLIDYIQNIISTTTFAQNYNTEEQYDKHIDACFTKWKRYPNYLNIDFISNDTQDAQNSIIKLNQKLHSLNYSPLRNVYLRPTNQNPQKSINLCQNWIEENLSFFLTPKKDISLEHIEIQLGPLSNLVFVIFIQQKNEWNIKIMREIQIHLKKLVPIVENVDFSKGFDLIWMFPFLLIEKYFNTTILQNKFKEKIEKWVSENEISHPNMLCSLELMGIKPKKSVDEFLDELLVEYSKLHKIKFHDYSLTHFLFYKALTDTELKNKQEWLNILKGRIYCNHRGEKLDLTFELIAVYFKFGGEASKISDALSPILCHIDNKKSFRHFVNRFLDSSSKHNPKKFSNKESIFIKDFMEFQNFYHGILTMFLALDLGFNQQNSLLHSVRKEQSESETKLLKSAIHKIEESEIREKLNQLMEERKIFNGVLKEIEESKKEIGDKLSVSEKVNKALEEKIERMEREIKKESINYATSFMKFILPIPLAIATGYFIKSFFRSEK